jgi:hypothetical protein
MNERDRARESNQKLKCFMCSLYQNEYSNFKLVSPLWEGARGEVKRSGRDEPILVLIHIYMETSQGTFLYSYLYLKLTKTPYFSFQRIRGQNRFCLKPEPNFH